MLPHHTKSPTASWSKFCCRILRVLTPRQHLSYGTNSYLLHVFSYIWILSFIPRWWSEYRFLSTSHYCLWSRRVSDLTRRGNRFLKSYHNYIPRRTSEHEGPCRWSMNRFIFDFFVSVKKTNEDFAAAKSLIFPPHPSRFACHLPRHGKATAVRSSINRREESNNF